MGKKAATSNQITYNLAGTVRHQGLPVAGVTLNLYGGKPNGAKPVHTYKTTGKGDFQFTAAIGTYFLEVVPDAATCFTSQVHSVVIEGNTTLNVNLVTGAILKGKIYTADGDTIYGAELVAAELGAKPCVRDQALDEKGCFSLVLPRGSYLVAVRSCAREGAGKPFLTNFSQVLDLARDATVNFSLPRLVNFEGRIVDGQGNPVPLAPVQISSIAEVLSGLKIKACTASDENGFFNLKVEPGVYEVSVKPPEFSPLTEWKDPAFEVSDDLSQNFVLAQGVRLSGSVSFKGKPLDGAFVQIRDVKKNISSSVPVLDSGRFVVGLGKGEWEVSVIAPEGSSCTDGKTLVSLDEDKEIELCLKEAFVLEGKALDAEGNARPSVKISVQDSSAPAKGSGGECLTALDGSFRFLLPSGTYKLAVNDNLAKAEEIRVDKTAVRHDVLLGDSSVLKLKVVAEDDAPVAGCRIKWSSFDPHPQGKQLQLGLIEKEESEVQSGLVLTDEAGLCQITLTSGIYTLEVEPPSASGLNGRIIRQLSVSQDMKRKIKLASGEGQ